jgi:nucleoside-diphosphate-sugar epimerase
VSGVHLVTGGAGYFGTLLVDALVRVGKQVRILDVHDAVLPDGVEKIRADIRDAAAVDRACQGVEVIHHNVALVPLAKDRTGFVEVNVDGTENLLRAAHQHGVHKVVSMSSSAVYGAPERNPVDDQTPRRPVEDYGRAKLAAEELCGRWVERGLDVTIVRPRTIMGHGRLGIMQILFEWVRQGRNIPVLGRGDNLYQFLHADDLASACLKAAARPGATTYNVGAETFGTMRETLESLCRHAGTGSRVVSVPLAPAVAFMRQIEQRRNLAARRVPRADVRPLDLFRHLANEARARLVPALHERRNVHGVVRLVRRPPRRGARKDGRFAPPLPRETGNSRGGLASAPVRSLERAPALLVLPQDRPPKLALLAVQRATQILPHVCAPEARVGADDRGGRDDGRRRAVVPA